MMAVDVRALTKSWSGWWGPPHVALDRLDLAIPRGAAFGLIGPNGAGKTTFIKLLLGVARPTSGTLCVLGGDPEDRSVRQRIGYLPERLHLPAALKAGEVLRSAATLKSLSPSDGELRALLERVGLGDVSRRVGTFSKGMRQRLGLAAARASVAGVGALAVGDMRGPVLDRDAGAEPRSASACGLEPAQFLLQRLVGKLGDCAIFVGAPEGHPAGLVAVRFAATDGRWWVEDLFARARPYRRLEFALRVNDREVVEAYLRPGDTLELAAGLLLRFLG